MAATDESVLTVDEARRITAPLYDALNRPAENDVSALLARACHDDYRPYRTNQEFLTRDRLADVWRRAPRRSGSRRSVTRPGPAAPRRRRAAPRAVTASPGRHSPEPPTTPLRVCDQPCTSRSGGPSPPRTECRRTSPVSTYRLAKVSRTLPRGAASPRTAAAFRAGPRGPHEDLPSLSCWPCHTTEPDLLAGASPVKALVCSLVSRDSAAMQGAPHAGDAAAGPRGQFHANHTISRTSAIEPDVDPGPLGPGAAVHDVVDQVLGRGRVVAGEQVVAPAGPAADERVVQLDLGDAAVLR
jgi:hypothetical protein